MSDDPKKIAPHGWNYYMSTVHNCKSYIEKKSSAPFDEWEWTVDFLVKAICSHFGISESSAHLIKAAFQEDWRFHITTLYSMRIPTSDLKTIVADFGGDFEAAMQGNSNYVDWKLPFGKLHFLLTHFQIFGDYVLVGKGKFDGNSQDVENIYANQKLVEKTVKSYGDLGDPFDPHTSFVYLKKLHTAYQQCFLTPSAPKLSNLNDFVIHLKKLIQSINISPLPNFRVPLQSLLVEIWPSKEKTSQK